VSLRPFYFTRPDRAQFLPSPNEKCGRKTFEVLATAGSSVSVRSVTRIEERDKVGWGGGERQARQRPPPELRGDKEGGGGEQTHLRLVLQL
jgi:hypothetical protein